MFFLLIACSTPKPTTIPIEPSRGWIAIADTGFDSTGSDTATDTDSECYVLEGRTKLETDCYTTRPYIEIRCELAVGVYDSNSVIWDVTVEAAPEGWVGVNTLGTWLSIQDSSGTGWTEGLIDRLSYLDQNGDSHAISVVNSNTSGMSVVVGSVETEEGWAVDSVEAGHAVTVRFVLDIQGLDVHNGDWVQLDLNEYQTWSSDEVTSVESRFESQLGTRFLFL